MPQRPPVGPAPLPPAPEHHPIPCLLKVSIHSVWLGNSITPLARGGVGTRRRRRPRPQHRRPHVSAQLQVPLPSVQASGSSPVPWFGAFLKQTSHLFGEIAGNTGLESSIHSCSQFLLELYSRWTCHRVPPGGPPHPDQRGGAPVSALPALACPAPRGDLDVVVLLRPGKGCLHSAEPGRHAQPSGWAASWSRHGTACPRSACLLGACDRRTPSPAAKHHPGGCCPGLGSESFTSGELGGATRKCSFLCEHLLVLAVLKSHLRGLKSHLLCAGLSRGLHQKRPPTF